MKAENRQRFQRSVIRMLKQPRFWFLVLVYPLLIALYIIAKASLVPLLLQHSLAAGFCVYLICAGTSILTTLSALSKLFNRDLQGQKLRLREQQGLEIEPKR